MYNIQDTIVAVSSPTNDHNIIIRITGHQAISVLNQICVSNISENPGISKCKILIADDIVLDALVYFFRQPNSYTGDDLAEIHFRSNQAVTEALLQRLLSCGARPAQAGEFTARAYLNNKIDLAQAEAVNEVITSSNTFQLAAAENLLAGRFGQTLKKIDSQIIDTLSRIEAGLDFSTEDIESPNQADTIASLKENINQLRELLNNSVHCESTLDLPSVGIAGSPNAGKSTLLNKLLGRKRSIVSNTRKTTRDVLTGQATFHNCRCVIFDCAGLMTKTDSILDELARQAAIEELRNATAVLFCVDITKSGWSEDYEALKLFAPRQLIPVATKCDLPVRQTPAEKILQLNSFFGFNFIPISAHAGSGLDELRSRVAEGIIAATSGHNKQGIALTSRHRQTITAAIVDLEKAVDELKNNNDELTAMMLRSAHNQLNQIEQHNLDEQLLDRIFSRFCIGK